MSSALQTHGSRRLAEAKRIFIKRLVLAGLCLLLLLLAVSPLAAQGNELLVLEAQGPISPALFNYLERGIAAAEARAAPVVVVLDTPGGSVETMQEIVALFRNARVPVLVYVGPAGAQAASAGSVITLAAHASGMAPETVIGAASPVGGSGEDIEDTLYRKLVEDLKAQVRGLAERRGPEAVVLAEAMIEDARAVHAQEAAEAGLIDAVAPDLSTFLQLVDGRQVVVNEQTVALDLQNVTLVDFDMTFVERGLHALSNSLLISILLAIGVPALLIELKTPGGWVPGFIGILSLGLAFYGLGQLPVNWLGLGLVIGAFALFLLELKAPGIGALAFAGAGTLLAGLLVLFNSPSSPSFIQISVPAAVTITLIPSALFLFVITQALKAQRKQPLTGAEGLIGRSGRIRKTLVPAPSGPLKFTGSALVQGEIWQVVASQAIGTDETVIVTGMDGFTLHVEPAYPGES